MNYRKILLGCKEVVLGVLYALGIAVIVFVALAWLGRPQGFEVFGWKRYNQFYFTHLVTSGSMAPTLMPGDLVVTVPPPRGLKPGMIAAFQQRDGRIVIHRIVRITAEGFIITKGDANDSEDRWFDEAGDYHLLSVSAIYTGIRLPRVGYLSNKLGEFGGAVRALASPILGEFSKVRSVSTEFQAGYWP